MVEQKLYKGCYLVCSNGDIKRITKTGKVVDKKNTTTKQNNGYVRTTINYKNEYVHRIVASLFIGDIEGMDVDHLDGNKENNDVSNLDIVTHKENVRRRDEKLSGSLYERSNYKNKRITSIIYDGIEYSSQTELAKKIGVKQSQVSVALRFGYKLKGKEIKRK